MHWILAIFSLCVQLWWETKAQYVPWQMVNPETITELRQQMTRRFNQQETSSPTLIFPAPFIDQPKTLKNENNNLNIQQQLAVAVNDSNSKFYKHEENDRKMEAKSEEIFEQATQVMIDQSGLDVQEDGYRYLLFPFQMENSSTQQTIALQQDDRRSKADTQIIEIFPVQNDLFLSPELYDDSPKNTSSIRSQNQIDDILKNKEDGSQQSTSSEVIEKQEGLVQLLIPIGIQFQDDVQENGSYLDELYKQQVGSEVSGNGSEVQVDNMKLSSPNLLEVDYIPRLDLNIRLDFYYPPEDITNTALIQSSQSSGFQFQQISNSSEAVLQIEETSSINQDNEARVNKVNCNLSFLNQLLVISMIWVLDI
eukprot:TRINITY_DN2566_c0_g1_i4.p1 TRINITY_DN2566_c0_g1~~TRINITY_DN2566_c0_g1_i4.p1  ORF type:complete len:366 (-),score=32.74 TRINITY_DN2566_c0_g1_i4:145-1242(-)